jgi:hypothetical protein
LWQPMVIRGVCTQTRFGSTSRGKEIGLWELSLLPHAA